jgi:hypothetical protein
MVAFPVPEAGLKPVSHGTSLEIVQEHEAVSTMVNDPPGAGKGCVGGVSVYEHPADCVTVNWTLPPAPWTVT